MDLLVPSKRILEAICWDPKLSLSQQTTFPPNDNQDFAEEGMVAYQLGIAEQIKSYYSRVLTLMKGLPIKWEVVNLQEVCILMHDALKNARSHGSRNIHPYTHALFLAPEGICHGFQDAGDYFKREDVKRKWESKKPITEFDPMPGCCHAGADSSIYPYSDIIEVDTQNGVLYCVQFKERIILS